MSTMLKKYATQLQLATVANCYQPLATVIPHRVLHYIVGLGFGFSWFRGLFLLAGCFLGFGLVLCFLWVCCLPVVVWSVCCVCAWTAGCACLGAGLGSLGLPARGVSVPGAVSFQCTMYSAPGLGLARPNGHYTR
jgi:hypothetical protein